MSWEVDSINLLRGATHPKLDKDLYFKDLQKAFSFRSLSWAEKQAKNSILQNLKNKWEKNISFYIFSCPWTCTNTSRICFIAVTISLWYQVKNSAHIYKIVHNNLLDYYSFRVCLPNENKAATNIDNQMYEEPLWLWLAVIHESSAEAAV